MLSPKLLSIAGAILLAAAPSSAQQTCLTTLYATNNGGSPGGAVYFDIDVLNPAGVTISAIDVNSSIAAGTAISADIYTALTTSVGKEQNMLDWTLVSSGTGTAAGQNLPSTIDVTDFFLAFGTHGFMIDAIDFDHDYTNGNGGNQSYADANIKLDLGTASNVEWGSPTFSPRVFNGAICYLSTPCASNPVNYCTAGTTTGGCNATMGSIGTASLSNAAPFTLTVSNVDGNKNGIIFYSITGQNSAPWGNSQSILCIKSPTQRMNPPANSGGTVGLCDGSYANDWNAYVAANPLKAINLALVVGSTVDAQSWFRDGGTTGPVGAKGTALSDGLEFTVCP